MKHEYIPVPKANKTKRLATILFFAGLVLFVLGAVKMIPYRAVIQVASLATLTASIMLVGRFLLRAYAYRIEDMGEGDEFFVDEITRRTRYSVCRLEMRKLVAIHPWDSASKELKNKKRYSYCPDIFGGGAYLLEFFDSDYDITSERIFVKITPDEKLLEILGEAVLANKENSENAENTENIKATEE